MMIHGTRSEWGRPSCGITGVILTITLLTLGIYLMRVARWHLRDYPTLIGGGWADGGFLVHGTLLPDVGSPARPDRCEAPS